MRKASSRASTKLVKCLSKYKLLDAMNCRPSKEDCFALLHVAVQLDLMPVVRQIVDNGADLDVTNRQGFTPVQIAASLGYLNMVEFLESRRGNQEMTRYNKASLNFMSDDDVVGHNYGVIQLFVFGVITMSLLTMKVIFCMILL